jgi:Na+-translocating ferredoxin:NAD+ oxidoreductase subunit G
VLSNEQQDRVKQRLGWELDRHKFQVFRVYKEADCLGYAMIVHEQGKYRPITFLAGLNPDFSVKEVVVMVYREKIGSSVRKKRFLKQFISKKSSDPLHVDQDIMGISGATISSWSLAAGVKKALVILEDVFQHSPEV